MAEKNIDIQIEEGAPRRFKPFLFLNENIRFWGLSSLQIMAIVGIVVFVGLIVNVILGIMLLVPAYFMTRKLRQEYRKGNPSYLEAKSIYRVEKKRIEDENNVLQFLKKNDDAKV